MQCGRRHDRAAGGSPRHGEQVGKGSTCNQGKQAKTNGPLCGPAGHPGASLPRLLPSLLPNLVPNLPPRPATRSCAGPHGSLARPAVRAATRALHAHLSCLLRLVASRKPATCERLLEPLHCLALQVLNACMQMPTKEGRVQAGKTLSGRPHAQGASGCKASHHQWCAAQGAGARHK